MAAEIEGVIERSGYKLKRLTQAVRDRYAEIKALKSLLEETKRAAGEREAFLEARIETLKISLKNKTMLVSRARKKADRAETTAQAQAVRESAG